jgi:hypothetical protein
MAAMRRGDKAETTSEAMKNAVDCIGCSVDKSGDRCDEFHNQ